MPDTIVQHPHLPTVWEPTGIPGFTDFIQQDIEPLGTNAQYISKLLDEIKIPEFVGPPEEKEMLAKKFVEKKPSIAEKLHGLGNTITQEDYDALMGIKTQAKETKSKIQELEAKRFSLNDKLSKLLAADWSNQGPYYQFHRLTRYKKFEEFPILLDYIKNYNPENGPLEIPSSLKEQLKKAYEESQSTISRAPNTPTKQKFEERGKDNLDLFTEWFNKKGNEKNQESFKNIIENFEKLYAIEDEIYDLQHPRTKPKTEEKMTRKIHPKKHKTDRQIRMEAYKKFRKLIVQTVNVIGGHLYVVWGILSNFPIAFREPEATTQDSKEIEDLKKSDNMLSRFTEVKIDSEPDEVLAKMKMALKEMCDDIQKKVKEFETGQNTLMPIQNAKNEINRIFDIIERDYTAIPTSVPRDPGQEARGRKQMYISKLPRGFMNKVFELIGSGQISREDTFETIKDKMEFPEESFAGLAGEEANTVLGYIKRIAELYGKVFETINKMKSGFNPETATNAIESATSYASVLLENINQYEATGDLPEIKKRLLMEDEQEYNSTEPEPETTGNEEFNTPPERQLPTLSEERQRPE